MSGHCEQCQSGFWSFHGWDNSKRYRDLISGKAAKLCKRCIKARKLGEYRYNCKGCAVQVRGSFEDVRDLLNVLGRAFCQGCMIAFYGRYDAENPALINVLAGFLKRRCSMPTLCVASAEPTFGGIQGL